MKKALLTIAGLAVLAALTIAATDVNTQTIRYRLGSILKFDSQSSIADEDGAWSLSATDLKALDLLSTYTGTSLGSSNLFVWRGAAGVLTTKALSKTNIVDLSWQTNTIIYVTAVTGVVNEVGTVTNLTTTKATNTFYWYGRAAAAL